MSLVCSFSFSFIRYVYVDVWRVFFFISFILFSFTFFFLQSALARIQTIRIDCNMLDVVRVGRISLNILVCKIVKERDAVVVRLRFVFGMFRCFAHRVLTMLIKIAPKKFYYY